MTDEAPKSSLLKALHAVQANAPTLKKDKKGQYQNKYVSLDAIVEEIKPLLDEHGLVWSALPSGTADHPTLSYMLAHAESGVAITGEMPLMVGKELTSQALGSAITYARRYALCAVLNLVADDDDDGQAAQSYGRGSQRGSRVPSRSTVYKRETDSGEPATKAQKGKVRGEATKAGLKHADEWIAFTVREFGTEMGGRHIDELTKAQASYLIDRLQQGAIPTGESDVPSDGFQESLQGGDPVPWEGEK